MLSQKNDSSNLSDQDQNRQIQEQVSRLRNAIQDAGGNQVVAAKSGVPLSSLNGYIAGREMKLSIAQKIAAACSVSVEWLASGREPISPLPAVMRDQESILDYDTGEVHSLRDVIEFRLYDVKASAGPGTYPHTERLSGFIAIPRFMLPMELQHAAEDIIGLYVVGDSMTPVLTDGDLILINTKVKSVMSGFVYAIRNEDEVLVKRLNRHMNGDIEVISDNPRYKPQTIDAETARRIGDSGASPLSIIGKVVWRGGSSLL